MAFSLNVSADDLQLFNLPGKPTSPRFEIPDILWPQAHGDVFVCLWEDDKVAAVSLGIDDNVKPDHSWWISQLQPRGWNITWFIIPDPRKHIGSSNSSVFGNWSDFIGLHNLGFDIQSHGKTHGHVCDPAAPYYGDPNCMTNDPDGTFAEEYGEAVIMIDSNIPDSRVFTIAYSGININFEHDHSQAAKYYIAARTVGHGTPDPVNLIDYLGVGCASNLTINNNTRWLDYMTTKTQGKEKYYRSWMNRMWHSSTTTTENELEILDTYQDKLWVTSFTNAVMYNIEYTTHSLRNIQISSNEIRFSLSDTMNDSVYTYPLTLKIRVNNDWTNATVIQNSIQSPAKLVIGPDNNHYLLVKAVPDKGQVVVTKGNIPAAPVGLTVRRIEGM